ncbi:hypothetical protein I4U23_017297 [Adineta vaga]|nr:hypothetical protein I4U23_017297 [Adineta vaga]
MRLDYVRISLGAGVTYDAKSYPCEKVTVVGGYCILPWSQAVTLCNSDRKCGGFALTTDRNWRSAYDKNNEAAVSLYATGAKRDSTTNLEWTTLDKKCWMFNT